KTARDLQKYKKAQVSDIAPGRIRSPMLYPTELRAQKSIVAGMMIGSHLSVP
ncbi:MAG: hypothetical protein QOH48_1082, partial [Actinomycetota bacterium]|nr:hypothetical protein [Actinomycetota bacterium]